MWGLWKHRNVVVFDGVAPSANDVLGRVMSEGQAWKAARQRDPRTFFGYLTRWVVGDR